MADHSKSWNTEHYILAALGGTLAATLVVIIIFVILSPARISFSITHTSRSNKTDGSGAYLNLTIAANNTSHGRAAARYQSVFVNLKNSSSSAGIYTIPAKVDTALPTEYQPGPSVTSFNVSVLLLGDDLLQSFADRRSGLTVVVRAQVRFKIGLARTRLYDVMATWHNVLFPKLVASRSSNASATRRHL